MAHTLSTKKRVRQNRKTAAKRRVYKTKIRTAKKELLQAIASGKGETKAQHGKTVALIQRMAGKGVIHKKKAAHLISALTLRLNGSKAAAR